MEIPYFFVTLLACTWGSIVGLGGGVFIRPVFDTIGYHSVLNIQFMSSSAILIMAIVSTIRKMFDSVKIYLPTALLISIGAIIGGTLGNILLEHILSLFYSPTDFQRVQTIATIIVLSIALVFTIKNNIKYEIKSKIFSIGIGIFLGLIAVFLGIGGGPINVPFLMIFFGFTIKYAAAYSIVIIFFSHISRIIIMGITVGYGYFDMRMLLYVIPAAAIGGLLGAIFSKFLSDKAVKKLFILAIITVISLNIFNWFTL